MNVLRKVALSAVAFLGIALPARFAHATYTEGPVVRPQLFTSASKFELAAVVGYVSNDPYNRVIAPGGIVTYHLNDRSAIDVHAGYCMYSGKQLLSQVRQKIGRDPDVVSRPQFFVSGNYMWSPIYGKIAAFGEVVLHYDFFILGGVGVTGDQIETNSGVAGSQPVYTSKIFPLTDFSVGQHFFLSKKVAIRIELRPYIYWEQINNKWDPNGDVQILSGLSLLF